MHQQYTARWKNECKQKSTPSRKVQQLHFPCLTLSKGILQASLLLLTPIHPLPQTPSLPCSYRRQFTGLEYRLIFLLFPCARLFKSDLQVSGRLFDSE